MLMQEYLRDNETSPFGDWFASLDPQAAAIVAVAVARLGEGNNSNVKPIGEGVAEIRINRGPGFRVYFGWDGKFLMILLGDGNKRRQQDDIGDALAHWRDYKRRKAQLEKLATARLADTNRHKVDKMALTRSFKDTVQTRIRHDSAFRDALFQEAVQAFLEGDAATGRAVLRDFINGTTGFEALSAMTNTPAKSLMRMFGPKGNSTAEHLFGVIHALQRTTGVHLHVLARPDAA